LGLGAPAPPPTPPNPNPQSPIPNNKKYEKCFNIKNNFLINVFKY